MLDISITNSAIYQDKYGKSSVLSSSSLKPSSCSVPTYPLTGKFRASMAGMIEGSPVICGGRDEDEYSSACFKLIPNQWKQMPSLNEKRAYGSSSVFSNGSLWITGGCKSFGDHMSSSEVLDLGYCAWRSGPNLPMSISWHCVIQMNSTHIFLAGGYGNNSSNNHAFFYNDNKFEQLPEDINVSLGRASQTGLGKAIFFIVARLVWREVFSIRCQTGLARGIYITSPD